MISDKRNGRSTVRARFKLWFQQNNKNIATKKSGVEGDNGPCTAKYEDAGFRIPLDSCTPKEDICCTDNANVWTGQHVGDKKLNCCCTDKKGVNPVNTAATTQRAVPCYKNGKKCCGKSKHGKEIQCHEKKQNRDCMRSCHEAGHGKVSKENWHDCTTWMHPHLNLGMGGENDDCTAATDPESDYQLGFSRKSSSASNRPISLTLDLEDENPTLPKIISDSSSYNSACDNSESNSNRNVIHPHSSSNHVQIPVEISGVFPCPLDRVKSKPLDAKDDSDIALPSQRQSQSNSIHQTKCCGSKYCEWSSQTDRCSDDEPLPLDRYLYIKPMAKTCLRRRLLCGREDKHFFGCFKRFRQAAQGWTWSQQCSVSGSECENTGAGSNKGCLV